MTNAPATRRRTIAAAAALLTAAVAPSLTGARSAAADETALPTAFSAQSDHVIGLSAERTDSALDRMGPRRVRVPGRPARPGILWGWKITYDGFGNEIDRDEIWTRKPQPAVPPSWRIDWQRLGGVTVACGLERVKPDVYRATALSMTADGDRGTRTAAAAAGAEPLVRVRVRGSKLEARLRAKLDDGSRVRLTGVGVAAPVQSGQPLALSLRHSTVVGPLVAKTSSATGTVTGTWTIVPAVGRPEFRATWLDDRRGTVTFDAPEALAGGTGTIRRQRSGAYVVEGDDPTPVRMLVRPDGSGWFDAGFGRQPLPPGEVATGTR